MHDLIYERFSVGAQIAVTTAALTPEKKVLLKWSQPYALQSSLA